MFQSLNISGCLYTILEFFLFYDINVNEETMHILLNLLKTLLLIREKIIFIYEQIFYIII